MSIARIGLLSGKSSISGSNDPQLSCQPCRAKIGRLFNSPHHLPKTQSYSDFSNHFFFALFKKKNMKIYNVFKHVFTSTTRKLILDYKTKQTDPF